MMKQASEVPEASEACFFTSVMSTIKEKHKSVSGFTEALLVFLLH